MRIRGYRFAPPWWGIVLTIFGVVVLCLLGNWQIHRAHLKTRLQAAQAAARAAGPQPLQIRKTQVGTGAEPLKHGYRYIAHGHYDPDHQILLANQVEGTKNGYRVWTPLVLDSGVRVMVDRGWVAKSDDPDAPLPDPAAPTDEITVHGYWRTFPQPGLRLDDSAICDKSGWPRSLNYPGRATVRCQYGAPVADGLLLLNPDDPNGFLRDWDTDDIGLTPFAHYAYASQWFLMAFVVVVIFGVVNLKRPR